MRPESIIEAIGEGEEEVRGQATTRYQLKVDVERIHWSQSDRGARTPFGRSVVGRLLGTLPPDQRPQGILSAEVWIDREGRLVRYSHSDVPVDHPKHAQAPWTAVELWDFGIPPALNDSNTQAVIDPVTLQFPESEADFIRSMKADPDAPTD